MKSSHLGKLSLREKGLRYKLRIIEVLMVFLPLLIFSYIIYENNVFLKSSQMVIVAFTLVLILCALIILRQVFDRIFMLAIAIKKAKEGHEHSADIHKDIAELNEISVSYSNLFKKYKETTEELRCRIFELFALKELTEIASKILNIDELLSVLLEKAMAVTEAQIGSVFMVESEKERFRVVASRGLESGPKKDSYMYIQESLARLVISDGKPLLIQDIETDPRIPKLNDPKHGSPSFLSMPIFARKKLTAILNLSDKESKQVFDSNDVQILSVMIGEISFAVENARLHLTVKEQFKNLQEFTEELTHVNDRLKREIIERERAEEKSVRIAAELRQLVDTANAPIFGINKEGLVTEWNRATEKITGFTKGEVIGSNLVEDCIAKDSSASVKEVLIKALKGEETASFEFPLRRKDGRRLKILLNATTRRDVAGNAVGVIGVGQDITELSRYRNSLEQEVKKRTGELDQALYDAQKARERTEGILKSVADGLIVTDVNNRVILMNPAAEDLLNVCFSEVIDRPIDYAIQDKTLRDRIKGTLEKRETDYQFDFELQEKDSKHSRIMRARTSGIKDKTGKQSGIVTIICDMTAEHKMERMKAEFVSTAAHCIRTPLTSIQGFSEILLSKDDLSNEQRKKFLDHINKQARKLAEIATDFLDISRIESSRGLELHKVKCPADELIREVFEYFQGVPSKHKIEVVLPDRIVELYIDKEKMEKVLINVLSNAIKFSPEGGVIRVTGKVFEEHYQLSVEDQGIGMTPEQAERIFDKFYRADCSDSALEGKGLGMSIVKYIVEAHGGKIWVESELGKGTTVKFLIPKYKIQNGNRGL